MQTFALSRSIGEGTPDVAGFFDPRTFSVQYVVSDPATKR
ncbi:MBL fold metallo-hydrolase, partial [Halomonas titanicae]|nr:MBL fold metallo-hydrolase [Halomonas titanicae]